MSLGTHSWSSSNGLRWPLSLALGVALAAAVIGLRPGLAWGSSFRRGDVFLSGLNPANGPGIQEYSPSGQLRQTLAGSYGATALCFNPSGGRLVVPGVGLFNRSGHELLSHWASDPVGSCVVDGSRHVYVAQTSPVWSIAKYNLRGHLLQTFTVANTLGYNLAIDLAPDECTIYYGGWSGNPAGQVGRFNVCSGTQQAPFASYSFTNDLRVLPDWKVLLVNDAAGQLWNASGHPVRAYSPGIPIGDGLRYASLDPDGVSFWMSGAGVVRYNIHSGALLSEWGNTIANGPTAGGPIAVYSPPLLGNPNLAPRFFSRRGGTAEAFRFRSRYSGRLNRLHVWINRATTAGTVLVGVYSNRFGRPGTLQARGTLLNVRPGSWNVARVPRLHVRAHHRYWVAVLTPRGGGRAGFRDSRWRGRAILSARHNLTALPAHWRRGRRLRAGLLSAYGS